MRRGLVLAALLSATWGATLGSAWLDPTAASGAAPPPTVQVTPGSVEPGKGVVVRLAGWPLGTVTVGVCGNEARRGSPDCALTGDLGIAVRSSSDPTLLDLTVLAPPMPCPCVIRAVTPDGTITRTTPIELVGVAIAPVVGPADISGHRTTRVAARVTSRPSSWPRSWAPAFAGTVPRRLEVTIRNTGATPLTGLRVVSAVGHDRSHGEPIRPVKVRAIPARSTRTVRIPFELAVPAWGDYEVFGSVYGLDGPIRFSGTTSNDPWGLEVLAPLVLLGLARVRRRTERRRRTRSPASVGVVAGPSADGSRVLPQCSPRVGPADDGRWPVDALLSRRGGGPPGDHPAPERAPAAVQA